ncbi:metallophosphoesterase family protein [Halorubrum salinum]|uniref:metallophosphoesterase family protein n=1 Tax=Halorubrum salinum TaxID=767517 RepID=UPI0021125E1A|nr:metallophosphoesterase [Halorubrum salinum]
MVGEFEKYIENEVVILTRIDVNEPKVASLRVRRSNGTTHQFRLSDNEPLNICWAVGEEYELKDVELRSRSDGGHFLAETDNTSVRRVSNDAFDFLVVGDTHFGYRNRTTNVDSRYINGYEFNVLDLLVELSDKWNIDGILHTGDLFDHRVDKYGYNNVKEKFDQLGDMDVEVLFVTGNHDNKVESRISSISSLPNINRLDQTANWGSMGGFNILGLNSSSFNNISDFDWTKFEQKYKGPNVLIAHPKSIDMELSTFDQLIKDTNEEWFIFLGHHHEEGEIDEKNLKIIFTGFPSKLDDTGSVWRMRGGNGHCRIVRHRLGKWNKLY